MDTVRALMAYSSLPKMETRILLQAVLRANHAWLIGHLDDFVTEQQSNDFVDLVHKRLAGKPIAYLTRQREFYGLNFIVNEDVLIPRPETELLIDIAREILSSAKESRVLDLGTGSGAIAVVIAKMCPHAQVYATDQSHAALSVARQNAEQHQVDVKFLQGNWFEAIPPMCFDLIVSNPPYIVRDDPHLTEGDLRFEPKTALTDGSDDGLAHLRHIIAYAPNYLNVGGQLWVEHGYDQAAACRSLLQEYGFSDTKSVKDLNHIERVSGGKFFQVSS